MQFYREQPIKHGETVHIISMRDGALKVKFKIRKAGEDDWFGVFIRSSQPNPWMGGYLLYIRKNGSLELAGLPVNLLGERKYPQLRDNEEHILQFEIDGDNLVAYLDSNLKKYLKVKGLVHQSPGDVSLSCYGSDSSIVFREVETVIRDTMNFDLLKRQTKI